MRRGAAGGSWVEIGASAAERTRLAWGHGTFAQQCAFCEREAINVSLGNLLTFPWIKEAVERGQARARERPDLTLPTPAPSAPPGRPPGAARLGVRSLSRRWGGGGTCSAAVAAGELSARGGAARVSPACFR